jgi:hypothetical protein
MEPSLKDIVITLSKLLDDAALNDKVVVHTNLINFMLKHVKDNV